MSRSYEKIEDHFQFAENNRTPTQFVGKKVFGALLKAFLNSTQDVEDSLWQMFTERGIYQAEGQQLDDIGAYIQYPRPVGTPDSLYRELLLGEATQRTSDSTPTKVMNSAKLTYQTSFAQVYEHVAREGKVYNCIVVRTGNPVEILNGFVRDSLEGPETLKSVSPATTGSVAVLKDYRDSCWIPSEVTLQLSSIVADQNPADPDVENIITNQDFDLVARTDNSDGVVNAEDIRGRLAEIGLTPRQLIVEQGGLNYDFQVEGQDGTSPFNVEEEGLENTAFFADVEQVLRVNR